jgi:hypothetical protein
MKLHQRRGMTREAVVILGNGAAGQPGLDGLVAGFDWSLEKTATLEGLMDISARKDVVAVLVDSSAVELPWKQAISAVREVVPGALVILCHRFSNTIDWVEAAAAGAYHLLGLPLGSGEFRQSLGFVWASKNKPIHVIPLTDHDRSRVRKSGAALVRGSRAAGNVA